MCVGHCNDGTNGLIFMRLGTNSISLQSIPHYFNSLPPTVQKRRSCTLLAWDTKWCHLW